MVIYKDRNESAYKYWQGALPEPAEKIFCQNVTYCISQEETNSCRMWVVFHLFSRNTIALKTILSQYNLSDGEFLQILFFS